MNCRALTCPQPLAPTEPSHKRNSRRWREKENAVLPGAGFKGAARSARRRTSARNSEQGSVYNTFEKQQTETGWLGVPERARKPSPRSPRKAWTGHREAPQQGSPSVLCATLSASQLEMGGPLICEPGHKDVESVYGVTVPDLLAAFRLARRLRKPSSLPGGHRLPFGGTPHGWRTDTCEGIARNASSER